VQVDLRAEVVPGQHVAVEHHDGVVGAAEQALRRVPDAAAGAQRLGLVRVDDLESVPRAVAEHLREHLGPVGGCQHDPAHARVGRPGQLVREEGDARGRQQRLGRTDRQRAQPGPLAADQQDRLQ
jgi:hypothetical protein